MARSAFQNAVDAMASVRHESSSDVDRAEEVIRKEIDRAVECCALDVIAFARALGVLAAEDEGPVSPRSAKRSIVMQFHPDKVGYVVDGDAEEDTVRKRLQSVLCHSIVAALSTKIS